MTGAGRPGAKDPPMHQPITRGDLDLIADRIEARVDDRCERIEKRLDILNGKTITHGEEIARHSVRLTSTEKELFDRPSRRRDDVVVPDEGSLTITRKQLTGWIGIGTMVGAALVKLWPVLSKGLQ